MAATQNNRKFKIRKEPDIEAAKIRDAFTFEVEVEVEDGRNYKRTFIPSVLHINKDGQQSVASRTEARPLTGLVVDGVFDMDAERGEHNFFMEFERRPDEQIFLVNVPIDELTVDEIAAKMEKKWAARWKDDGKVSFLFICKKNEDDKWIFRTATEKIYITDEGNGGKRAKMAAHRSHAGGVFNTEDIDIYSDPSMHTGERCRRDGAMVGSFELAQMLNIDLSSEPRTNMRFAGNDGDPFHGKGDIIWSEFVKGGSHLRVCPCNIKRDGGLMVEGKILFGSTGPQRQGEAVVSNPQSDASAGHVTLDRKMYANGPLSVWEHQAMAKMGKTLSRVLLGKNPFFSGLDPEEQKLNRRAHVAGYVERQLGDAFISPAVTMSNIEAAEAMYGEDSKHRVTLPGTYSYSLTAPEHLDDMCFEGPRPGPGEIAIYSFGFVPHEDIFFSLADEGGGADCDDHFALGMAYASEAFKDFEANEFLSDVVRFPQGARIHEGKVGVEHSIVRVNQSTAEFKSLFKRTKTMFPVLDFHLLPEPTLSLPTPKMELPEPEEKLSFMEEVRRLAELKGSYGRFSLRVTSLVYLATTFFKGQLPKVTVVDEETGEEVEYSYTLPIAMEDAIDFTTKHVCVEGMELVNDSADAATTYLYLVILQHMDGKVDPLFAKRAGLTDSDGNLLPGLEEAEWSMSIREEQWMWYHERLTKFTQFLSEQYRNIFKESVTALGGHERNSVTDRFWAGLRNRRQEGKHESIIVEEMGHSISDANLSMTEIQNLQRMQEKDIRHLHSSYMVSEILFSLPMVEQTVEAVDVDLHQNILTGVMDRVWTPLLKKVATSYDGDYRTDPFIGQVVSGFDRYFGGGFDNLDEMVSKAEEDTAFLVSCMERAADEAVDLQEEYDDATNIVLCEADTTRGHPCKKRAATCPYH